MDNKSAFIDLRQRLNMPSERLTRLLNRSLGTLKRYANQGDLQPPDVVIEQMKVALRGKAFEDLEAADCDLRFTDSDGYVSLWVEYKDTDPNKFRNSEAKKKVVSISTEEPTAAKATLRLPSAIERPARRPAFLTRTHD